VDSLPGCAEDRRRLKLVLGTLGGEVTLQEAARELGVSEARFHQLRRQILEGALAAAAPGLPGRPRKETPAEPGREQELLDRVKWLEEELQCALVRTEIALVRPELLKRKKPPRRKKGVSSRSRRPGKPPPGGSPGT
jgi:hypothetical protein